MATSGGCGISAATANQRHEMYTQWDPLEADVAPIGGRGTRELENSFNCRPTVPVCTGVCTKINSRLLPQATLRAPDGETPGPQGQLRDYQALQFSLSLPPMPSNSGYHPPSTASVLPFARLTRSFSHHYHLLDRLCNHRFDLTRQSAARRPASDFFCLVEWHSIKAPGHRMCRSSSRT